MRAGALTVFLCGDVMLGRGVDQILAHPGDPALREPVIEDARAYVSLAEAANGPIPRPVDPSYPWGEALEVLDAARPDVRVVNLETSITRGGDFDPGKAIHYRMHPANLDCLAAVRPDVCVLANNHVLDFGRSGLDETLDTLASGGLRWAGAGRRSADARRPACVPVAGERRVLVFAIGMVSSGVPPTWAATEERSGVDFMARPSPTAAEELAGRIDQVRRDGDAVIVSVHWGSNWGYEVPDEQIRFAHALIDGGTDVVYGHSSHHPRPVEIHRGRPVLYGCGDLVNDYEGIGGYERYRDDLRLLHLVTLQPDGTRPARLRMVPMRMSRMRLRRAEPGDARWLRDVLDRAGHAAGLGTPVTLEPDGTLVARAAE